MITNERQYKLTKKQAEQFEEAIRDFDRSSPDFQDVHPTLVEAQYSAMKAQLEELKEDIKEYEIIKSGQFSFGTVNTLENLPLILIKARIAKGLTQADLADLLDMKEQQIQRYEAQNYSSASLEKLKTIAEALNIEIESKSSIKECDALENSSKCFPIKEMYSRGWFKDFTGSVKQALDNSDELLSSFLADANLNLGGAKYAMHKQNVRSGCNFNQLALFAWHARILIKAKNIPNVKPFKKNKLNSEWIENLVKLSAEADGISRVEEYLRNSGIRFIVEPHLPETHLDGACLLLEDKHPIIAMTLRHDRIDNFWFVLLHELAHLILHVNEDTKLAFFDNLDSEQSGMEEEADKFALNALINEQRWRKSISRFICTEAAVKKEAQLWGINPAIVAGRIRKETGKYILFNNLMGNGKVRECFQDVIVN